MMECIQAGIGGLPKVPRRKGKVQRKPGKTMQTFEERKKEYQGAKKVLRRHDLQLFFLLILALIVTTTA